MFFFFFTVLLELRGNCSFFICCVTWALSTLIRFQTKTELFCSGYDYRPHYNAENDHQKRNHSKTLSTGPVHTNPFSNENGAVLLRFQKDLRPHLSFSYRFCPSTLQRRICLKTLLYPQNAWSNEPDACAFQYIGQRNWREIKATW